MFQITCADKLSVACYLQTCMAFLPLFAVQEMILLLPAVRYQLILLKEGKGVSIN